MQGKLFKMHGKDFIIEKGTLRHLTFFLFFIIYQHDITVNFG